MSLNKSFTFSETQCPQQVRIIIPSLLSHQKIKWDKLGIPSIQFPIKLNMHLLYDPAIWLLGSYSREIKAVLHKDLYTNIVRVLLIIASTGNNPKWETNPSMGKEINKLCYIHTVKFYLAIKWMNYLDMLWVILKSHYADRRHQTQKNAFCEILYETLGKTHSIDSGRKQINSNLGLVVENELERSTRVSLGERNGPISWLWEGSHGYTP